ncbi:N-acetylmuramoyl-L-alanine amidase [Rhodococcus sp. NPDC058514]|uniref:N-acetylmuramoyl-L-alanine amidase n=1 Tax=unclassified Rhodococcus (in: high G+C Gram-positive bacteria) TaxID=192944 RepID=UPI00364B985A
MKMTTMMAGLAAATVTAMVLPAGALAQPVAEAAAETPLTGRTVFLDPGHQGTAHTENLSRQVDDGRGGKKDCQTTGMTSRGGVPEHTINWDVSQLVKTSLETLGATVVLSRQDDSGWGGCVDDRARAANESGADLAISIHADSTTAEADASRRGFHMIVPELPVPDAAVDKAQSGPGLQASRQMRDVYVKNGFTPANYAGVVEGLQTRGDVAGPALTTVPLVFVEMGNGSNPEDSAVLDSLDGRLKHAIAITTGAVNYLMEGGVAEPAPAAGATTTSAAPTTTTTVAPPSASATKPAKPSTTTPSGTPDKQAPAGGGLTEVLALLQPLLEELGLGGFTGLATDENLGLVSNLLSGLLETLAGQGAQG